MHGICLHEYLCANVNAVRVCLWQSQMWLNEQNHVTLSLRTYVIPHGFSDMRNQSVSHLPPLCMHAAGVSGDGGIERLLCLYANSEDGPVRKNVAICVAKLAKQPELKQRITELRGMEMLTQAGRLQ